MGYMYTMKVEFRSPQTFKKNILPQTIPGML